MCFADMDGTCNPAQRGKQSSQSTTGVPNTEPVGIVAAILTKSLESRRGQVGHWPLEI